MNDNVTWPDEMGSLAIREYQNQPRDKPSWSRLSELESEMEELRGKVAVMERNQSDFEATLARVLRALPAAE